MRTMWRGSLLVGQDESNQTDNYMSVVFTQEGIFYKYYFEQPIVDEFIHKYFATVHFEQYCESMYNLHVIYNNPLKKSSG